MSDAALLQGLAAGDRAALGAIVDAHADRMVQVAAMIVHDRQLAEDVVHDLFVRWLRRPPKTATYTNLGAFLVVAVRHAAHDWTDQERSQRGLPPVGVPNQLTTVDEREIATVSPAREQDERGELQSLLERAIGQLSDDDRFLLEMRYGQGLGAAECAAILGTTLDVMHKRLQRARERIDAAIQQERMQHSSPSMLETKP